ncbi:hypothetical protein F8388_001482 [Cannabis sativa]|uniref:Uncharacterized protein n=1 Tax=Cannabis sativa TaxID=3483 RepID=A0A7J6F7S6_CANSA|nr:hypothetical protein F8388_001482 [Cannabis sativa]KAF4366763.1 hypothetical protein G4B88_022056 [Cannabis sativa]
MLHQRFSFYRSSYSEVLSVHVPCCLVSEKMKERRKIFVGFSFQILATEFTSADAILWLGNKHMNTYIYVAVAKRKLAFYANVAVAKSKLGKL